MIIKCKMCGGTIEFEQGATVGVCDFCGTKQTLPRLDDDIKANLYDRANHFRRNNDFDKAMGIYEQILNEDDTDAEVYWSLVLCRYGIEYVVDPTTHKRIPTVNRVQHTSIFMDEDYKSALKHADSFQRELYEQEAEVISEIQKGILEISNKEEPFDCFISFKETDANGVRTRDAVLAQDLYNELTKEGFKVFFAPVTLEDKLGTAYEPYIFAALNSAKVMIVLGTKPENFNAVWVKNEWSRYLALIKNGARKTLIPAYRDMDPYDLPEEFSHLMAQDMSKLGFMQDIIRGIRKLLNADEPITVAKQTAIVNGNNSIQPLLKRAFMFIEDGDWYHADKYCEKVLDQDPENARAYLGKLMVELGPSRKERLEELSELGKKNYEKLLRFGDEKLLSELNNYIFHIRDQNELDEKKRIYDEALEDMISGKDNRLKKAASKFESIQGFRDSDERRQLCLDEIKKKEAQRLDEIKKKEAQIKKDSDDVLKLLELYIPYRQSKSHESLQANQQNIEKLKNIASQFSTYASEIKDSQAKKEEIEQELSDLRIARNKLGIFATKDKKVTDKKIADKEAELDARISKITDCRSKLCGYSSIEQLNKDIEKLENTIVLKKEIAEKFQISSYTSVLEKIKELCKSPEVYSESIKKVSSLKARLFLIKEIKEPIIFGTYTFEDCGKKLPIKWNVLDIQGNKVLVISEYGLKYSNKYQYHSDDDGKWESSCIRDWLNNKFLNSSFSENEKTSIALTTVLPHYNPKYETDSGNATTDKVFLLSVYEVEKYLPSDNLRRCYGINSDDLSISKCDWWLRTPGIVPSFETYVKCNGCIEYYGKDGNCNPYIRPAFFRPALWIDLDSEYFKS